MQDFLILLMPVHEECHLDDVEPRGLYLGVCMINRDGGRGWNIGYYRTGFFGAVRCHFSLLAGIGKNGRVIIPQA